MTVGAVLLAVLNVVKVAAETGLLTAFASEISAYQEAQQAQVGACLAARPTNNTGGTTGLVDMNFVECTSPEAGWKIVGKEEVSWATWNDPDYWPCYEHEPKVSVHPIQDPLTQGYTVYCLASKPMGATDW